MDAENLKMKQPTVINCPQCGGTVAVEGDGVYASCPYCNSKFYFKDKEVTMLAKTVQELDEKIDTDTEGTADAKQHRWNGAIILVATAIVYFFCGISLWRVADTENPSLLVVAFLLWLTANIWMVLLLINGWRHNKGYDVYTNKTSKSVKVVYVLKWLFLSKVFQWVAFFMSVIFYVVVCR